MSTQQSPWIKASDLKIEYRKTYYAKWPSGTIIRSTGWFQPSDDTFFWNEIGYIPVLKKEHNQLLILDESFLFPSLSHNSKEEVEKEVLQSTMALVRAGYQQCADEILSYLNERKVTEDFMNGIAELLDPKNKKAFVYEVFEGELKDLQGEPSSKEVEERAEFKAATTDRDMILAAHKHFHVNYPSWENVESHLFDFIKGAEWGRSAGSGYNAKNEK